MSPFASTKGVRVGVRTKVVRVDVRETSEQVNLRLPRSLLDAVKIKAAEAGVTHQRYIRQVLEATVLPPKAP